MFKVGDEMQYIPLCRLQPSQFYISEEKLNRIDAWFHDKDLSNFEPVPVKLVDGKLMLTDGHTRCVAALQHSLTSVPFVWETDDLDWEMYDACVRACKARGVYSIRDLARRIISAEAYDAQWNAWCDELHEDIMKNRTAVNPPE